jgi:hypothetical protein
MRAPLVLTALLFAGGGLAVAEDATPPLVTDRPDQTESTSIVAPGRVQVEMGLTSRREDADGARSEALEIGGTLARVGLFERLELRLGWAGRLDEEVDSGVGPIEEADGSGDTALGAKLLLREEPGARGTRLALLAMASLPTGDDAFTEDRIHPELRLALSRALSERLSLGVNAGLAWASASGTDGELDSLSVAFYTAALGVSLGERWGTFAELFGEVAASDDGSPAHALDGGVTFLVSDGFQLDLAAGIGLSEAAEDSFVGAGLSFRLPR